MMVFPVFSKDKESNARASDNGAFSIQAIVDWLFAVPEREALDAKTGGDKSDGFWTWGM